MNQILAGFIPRLLTEDQGIKLVLICEGLLLWVNDENFLKTTRDETHIYGYDVEKD